MLIDLGADPGLAPKGVGDNPVSVAAGASELEIRALVEKGAGDA